jgi:ectoine hydroxylase-related dioxygenase (phytanoyl-CoA dioxygenase family)
MSHAPREALVPPSSTFEVSPTPEQVAFFREHGYLRVDRITTDEEVAWLGALYDRLFQERRGVFRGGYFDVVRPYDAEGEDLLPQLLMPELRYPELRETTYLRNARRIAAALLGADEGALESWGHMLMKPARRGHETPWHQDEAYWEAGKSYAAVGAWLPLDDATLESGCLHFLPGSHRLPVLPHRHLHDDARVHALIADGVDPTGAVPVPVPAGGATFHHHRMLHYAGPNRSERDRRAYASEFQLPPVARPGVEERPWLAAGREAWAQRQIPAR